MSFRIGVGCVDITSLEKKYVNEVLESGRLSAGPFLGRFESEFAKAHGVKYGLMVNSGTSALHIALLALGELYNWQDGDEIIVPAVTFVATANMVMEIGLKPVFVDVDARTYNIDPTKIEEKITNRTKAIIPVHLFGQPCDMDPILDIAKRYNLKIIEDSCETMFVKYRGRSVGSFGDVACFSTYIAHLIVTGVGGLAISNDEETAKILKSLANHGRDNIYITIDDSEKIATDRDRLELISRRFNFVRPGYSYRVTEMEGALGLAQLQRRQEIISGHQETAQKLLAGLKPFDRWLQLPYHPSYTEHAFMMFPIVIKDSNISKSDLTMFLEKSSIETRDMLPLTNQPVYRELYGEIENQYPVAQQINRNGFYIGCHQKITDEDVSYIVETFKIFFDTHGRK